MSCSPSHSLTLDSPVGPINIETCEDGIHSARVDCTVKDPNAPIKGKIIANGEADNSTLKKCIQWFTSYFQGDILDINFPLCFQGITPKMQDAYKGCSKIAPGESMTYGELNRKLARSGCARSLGAAMGKNRHLILVPCHRLVHSSGQMTKCATNGYLKPALLAHEKAIASSSSNGESHEEEEDHEEEKQVSAEESEAEEKPEPKSKARKTAKATEKKTAAKKTAAKKTEVKQEKQNGKKAAKKNGVKQEAEAEDEGEEEMEEKPEVKAQVKAEVKPEPKDEAEPEVEEEAEAEEPAKTKKTSKAAKKAPAKAAAPAAAKRTSCRKRKMAS